MNQNNDPNLYPQNSFESSPVENNPVTIESNTIEDLSTAEKKAKSSIGVILSGLNLLILVPILFVVTFISSGVVLIGASKTTPAFSPHTLFIIYGIYVVISVIAFIVFVIKDIRNTTFHKNPLKNPFFIFLIVVIMIPIISGGVDYISSMIHFSPGEYMVSSSTCTPKNSDCISLKNVVINQDKSVTLNFKFTNQESVDSRLFFTSFHIGKRFIGIKDYLSENYEQFVSPNKTNDITIQLPYRIFRNENIKKIDDIQIEYHLEHVGDDYENINTITCQFQIRKK